MIVEIDAAGSRDESERNWNLEYKVAPRVSRAPNFPHSLPLSSACHAGYTSLFAMLSSIAGL